MDSNAAAQTGASPTTLVAIEQSFPIGQRIIDDDLANKILPRSYQLIVKLMRIPALRSWMINLSERQMEGVWGGILCRKRYIDKKVSEAAAGRAVGAIVNLGAGFDTRVYRLPALASLPVWEVDQAVNLTAKYKGLIRALGAIPANVKFVPVNFMDQEVGAVINKYGYPPDRVTFFIWEAVSQYLTETAVRQTFDFLSQAPAGSQIVFTYIIKDFIEGRDITGLEKAYEQLIVKEDLWHFGFDPAEVPGFLDEYGWRLLEDLDYETLSAWYVTPTGRDLPAMKLERIVFAKKS